MHTAQVEQTRAHTHGGGLQLSGLSERHGMYAHPFEFERLPPGLRGLLLQVAGCLGGVFRTLATICSIGQIGETPCRHRVLLAGAYFTPFCSQTASVFLAQALVNNCYPGQPAPHLCDSVVSRLHLGTSTIQWSAGPLCCRNRPCCRPRPWTAPCARPCAPSPKRPLAEVTNFQASRPAVVHVWRRGVHTCS